MRVHTSGVGVLWEKEVWVCGNALLPIQNYRYVVSTHDTQYYILPSGWVRIAGPVMSPPPPPSHLGVACTALTVWLTQLTIQIFLTQRTT